MFLFVIIADGEESVGRVVPKDYEEIRFQISADLTEADIDQALNVLKDFGATAI